MLVASALEISCDENNSFVIFTLKDAFLVDLGV